MKLPVRFVLVISVAFTLQKPLVVADFYIARSGLNSDQSPYTSWMTAASNIQDAVSIATNNSTVWIAPGHYTAQDNPIAFEGDNVVHVSKPLVLRGVSGKAEDVIIDGEGRYRCVSVSFGGLDPFVLEGVTLTNGFLHGEAEQGRIHGAGLFINPSGDWTGEVRRCVFTHNKLTHDSSTDKNACGAGVSVVADVNSRLSNLQCFSDCVFRSNIVVSSYGYGGGLYIHNSYYAGLNSGVRVSNSLFEYNSASGGGGIYVGSLGTRMLHLDCVTFRFNDAPICTSHAYGGGALHQWPGGTRMWNCLMYGNSARGRGCAVYLQKTPNGLELYNCTVVDNFCTSGSSEYGALDTRMASDHIVMYNTIVFGNTPKDIYHTTLTGTNYYAYSCFSPAGLSGAGTVIFGPGNVTNLSPAFVDKDSGDYRLSLNSPCINAGTNQDWMVGSFDLAKNPRIDRVSYQVDMGCFEYTPHGSLFLLR